MVDRVHHPALMRMHRCFRLSPPNPPSSGPATSTDSRFGLPVRHAATALSIGPFLLPPDLIPLFCVRVALPPSQTGRGHRVAWPSPARPASARALPFGAVRTGDCQNPASAMSQPSRQETAPVIPSAIRGQTASFGPLRFFPFVCGGLFRLLLAKEQTTFNRKEKTT